MAKDDSTYQHDSESLKKLDGGADRAPRDNADVQRQVADGTVTTREERRKMFFNEWQQQALPTPPEIPGYHLCWLSTTNSYDPIHKRIRMGYEPVKASEVPGFDAYTMKSGEWKGFISANEMLLFKLPEDVYQDAMSELHYYQPADQEEAIKRALPEEQDSDGRQLTQIEGDGLNDLGSRKGRTPTFS